MADYLSKLWKTHFRAVKSRHESLLEKLQSTDHVPLAMMEANHLSAFVSWVASGKDLASMLGRGQAIAPNPGAWGGQTTKTTSSCPRAMLMLREARFTFLWFLIAEGMR